MKIRSFRQADAQAVSDIHNALYPNEKRSPAQIQQWLADGQAWVISDMDVIGYTAVFSVPGLAGVGSLYGGIAPKYQRQGLGSRLLPHILREASNLGIRQLSHTVTNLNSPAARFLKHHNFFIEHEEWLMRLPNLQNCRIVDSPHATCHLQTRPSPTQLFRRLYDKSFGNTPWYQPYSQEEVENTLDNPDDVLFLFKDSQPIGFAWLQGEMIEPIGIVKAEQGQGYGRILLNCALHKLKQRGASQAHIGVWHSNHAAIHLYQSLGFRHEKTLTYLALELED